MARHSAAAGHAPGRRTQALLVVPRAGTISPWSSKATDIAQVCGLAAVRRIERGIRYELGVAQPLEAGGAAARWRRLLFDRMTEMVVGSAAEAEQLFAHHAPRPRAHHRAATAAARRSRRPTRSWDWRSRPMRSAICWRPSRASGAIPPMPN